MSTEQKPKKKSRVLVIVFVAFGVCVGLLILSMVVRTSMQTIGLLPTDTPRPTATLTPPPTDTPIPTTTPLPTVTPTPLTLEDQFKKDIAEVLGESNRDRQRVINILILPDHIGVEWAINDGFAINSGAKLDIVGMLKVIQNSGLPYETISLDGTFSLIDEDDNIDEVYVVKTRYNRSSVEGVDFNMFLFEDVYDIADSATVHPAIENE